MSDPGNRITPLGKSGKKEMSMETRLLVAFALMGVVLFLTPYFLKPTPGPKPAKPGQPVVTTPKEAAKPVQAAADSPPVPPASANVLMAGKEDTYTLETELFRIRFSNRGGVVQSWTLKKFKDEQGKPLELVNQRAAERVYYPLALVFRGEKPARDINQSLFVSKPRADGLGVDYEFSDGTTSVKKSFGFAKDSYLADVSSSVTSNGRGIAHLLAWRGGFGDQTVYHATTVQHSLFFDLAANKLNTNEAKAAKDGPLTQTGRYSFAGLEDSFFAAVFLPGDRPSLEVQTYSDNIATGADKAEEAHVGAAVGGEATNQFSLFVGPKDVSLLARINQKLTGLVDFGRLSFLAKPLFLVLHWFNDQVTHNYGLAIILVTVLINLALLPLKISSIKSSKKMSALQPQIQAINDQYKNVKMNDPRKQEQNAAVMALYKKNGVNPAGGCLPLLLQMPFLFAFLTVLNVSIEMRGAHFLWITDLSRPESLPIHVLPLIMVVTQILVQKMTPAANMDPAQQKMMLFMPVIFTAFFFYNASSGLVLYWLTGNLVGILQQWWFNRATPPAVVTGNAVINVKPKSKR